MCTSDLTRVAVEGFLEAFEHADFARVQSLLSREAFSYEGPIDRFEAVGPFIVDLEKYALILKRIERRRLFVDGHEACAVLTFVTSVSDIERTRAVVWVQTDDGGLITRIESFLDARAYARMFEAAGVAAGDA